MKKEDTLVFTRIRIDPHSLGKPVPHKSGAVEAGSVRMRKFGREKMPDPLMYKVGSGSAVKRRNRIYIKVKSRTPEAHPRAEEAHNGAVEAYPGPVRNRKSVRFKKPFPGPSKWRV
jgi:hypothetical protein